MKRGVDKIGEERREETTGDCKISSKRTWKCFHQLHFQVICYSIHSVKCIKCWFNGYQEPLFNAG